MQCTTAGHYIRNGFVQFARLVNCINVAVNNRSVLRNVPSPVPVTTSLVGTLLSPYVRQNLYTKTRSVQNYSFI
jgi:hypothetical protein